MTTPEATQDGGLYATRQKIYPREIGGRSQRLRTVAVFVLLGIYYVLPWLRLKSSVRTRAGVRSVASASPAATRASEGSAPSCANARPEAWNGLGLRPGWSFSGNVPCVAKCTTRPVRSSVASAFFSLLRSATAREGTRSGPPRATVARASRRATLRRS